MSSSIIQSMSIPDNFKSGVLEFTYSSLVLILNKGIYHFDDGEVEIQLEGLSLGLDQKPYSVTLYYRFATESLEVGIINKAFQIGHFYQVYGNGINGEEENAVTFYYPKYDYKEHNKIPPQLVSLLVKNITNHDLCFEYHNGTEQMNNQYSIQEIFSSFVDLGKLEI